MNKSAQIMSKTPDAKKEHTISRKPITESSQSKRSPIDQILFLQRTTGNQAVQRIMKSGTLQAKLRIGQPNDKYEHEADRVADQVMRMPEPRLKRQPEEKKRVPLSVSMARNQCPKLDQVVLHWALRLFKSYANRYLFTKTYTKYKYWNRLSKDDHADIDIYFKEPGKAERHYKFIVKIMPPRSRLGLHVDGYLFSWLGKYPIELKHWLAILITFGGGCFIGGTSVPKPKVPPGPSRPSPPGTKLPA